MDSIIRFSSVLLRVQVGIRSAETDVGVYMPDYRYHGRLLGPAGRKGQVTEENSVMRSFSIFSPHQILLELLNQGE
jgi:hypothetical protein